MSYVTNPIANRLGIQQGWHNPLISLSPGLINISFITYLKCYLLMQEFLRYNQINLVFFEIKPLQKNKKLIHLFVYKSIFRLEKNELVWDSRKELTKNGFLQLILYLHQRSIKLPEFKLKKSYKSMHYNFGKKNGLSGEFAAVRKVIEKNSNWKQPWRKFKNFDRLRWVNKKILNFKKHKLNLKKPRQSRLIQKWNWSLKGSWRRFKRFDRGLYAKAFAVKVHNISKLFKLRRYVKNRANFFKSKAYYKKKYLLRKTMQYRFLNRRRHKNRRKRKKWWLRKSNTKPQLKRVRGPDQKTNKQINKHWFHLKLLRVPKLSILYTKLISANVKIQNYVPRAQKVFPSPRKLFSNFVSKHKRGQIRNPKKRNKNERKDFRLSFIRHQKTKRKKDLKITNNKFARFLEISKWLRRKPFLSDRKSLHGVRGKYKRFKAFRYMLWRNSLVQFLTSKLSPAFISKGCVSRKKKRVRALKLKRLIFNQKFDKLKKLHLVWKSRALYNLKIKNELKLHTAANPFIFRKYLNFVNAYQKNQKFAKLNSIKLIPWKKHASANSIQTRFYFRNFEMQFNKLTIQLQFLVENYIHRYMNFPVIAKIKNISDFIDIRSNKKTTDYTRYALLKPLAGKNFFIRLLYALLNTERVFNPQVFINLVATEMQKTKNYRKLVSNMIFMFSVLHSEHIIGYKVVIDGKLGGSKQKSTKQIFKLQNKEKIPIQAFKKSISYALGVARTPAGLFGIRMWLYY